MESSPTTCTAGGPGGEGQQGEPASYMVWLMIYHTAGYFASKYFTNGLCPEVLVINFSQIASL